MLFRIPYTRLLQARAHLEISPLTRKPSSNPFMSRVLSYLNTARHFDDFDILSSSSDNYELMIHDSLLIFKFKPSLNILGSSISLNLP